MIEEQFNNDEARISEELLRLYNNASRQEWLEQVRDDRQFKYEQWKLGTVQKLNSYGVMAVPINEVLPAIDLLIAILTTNDPRFTAKGRGEGDDKGAGFVADLMQWIWEISNGRRKINYAIRSGIEEGMGAMMVYVDPYADNGNGEIKITDIPIDYLYIDPNSREADSSDSEHIIYSQVISESRIKFLYPDIDLTKAKEESAEVDVIYREGLNLTYANPVPGEKYYRIIDRYTKVRIKRYYVQDNAGDYERVFENDTEFSEFLKEEALIIVKDKMETYVYQESQIEEYKKIAEQYGDTYHLIQTETGNIELRSGAEYGAEAIPNSTTQLIFTTKEQLIKDGILSVNEVLVPRIKRVVTIGGQLISTEIMPIDTYPIVTWKLHDNRNPYPCGDIRIVKPLQEQLNKLDSQLMNYLNNIIGVTLIVQRGSGLKEQIENTLKKSGVKVIEADLDSDSKPVVINYSALPTGYFEQRNNLILQIQRIIGAYALQDGAVGDYQTLGGMHLLDEMMQRRMMYKRRLIEDMLNQIGRVIAQLIPHVYTRRKVIRLSIPNHSEPKETIINDIKETGIINDVTAMQYDITVVSGSMLPTSKAQMRQELLQYYNSPRPLLLDPSPILRLLDLPNVDEIIEREDRVRLAEASNQELQQKIKELEGQIQTLVRELIHANQKIETTKHVAKLKEKTADLMANVNLAKIRLNDEVKKQKKELNYGND